MITTSVRWRIVHVVNAPARTAWRILAKLDGREDVATIDGRECGYSSLTLAKTALFRMVQQQDEVDNRVQSARIMEE